MFNPIIDSQKEHNQVLYELGLLDDMDDWELYEKQEDKYNKVLFELSDELVEQYLLVNGRKLIIRKV